MSGFDSADDLLALTGQAGYEWNISEDRLSWTRNFSELVRLRNADFARSGRGFETAVSAESGQSRYGAIFARAGHEELDGPQRYRCVYAIAGEHLAGGEAIWLEDTGVWYPGDGGRPVRAKGVVRIVNEQKSREEALLRRSDFDDLTLLPNRRYLEARVGEAITECASENSRAALLIISIERMDLINDLYGYTVGDEILKLAGERLSARLRSEDTIARFSGSKFGILLKQCQASEVYSASRRFIEVLSRDLIPTSAGPVLLNATVGACELPRHARTTQEAMAACFSASQTARRDKKLRFAVHDSSPARLIQTRSDAHLATRVISAIQAGNMRLAFQPVVAAATGRVAFHEALIRMVDGDGRIVEAGEFLSLGERLGFMRIIDVCALDLAIDTMQTHRQARLSINVSNASAEDPDWLSKLAMRLRAAPDIAPRLTVEITESHAASDLDETRKFVALLKDIGCAVAVDDFGAGYTSFSNLKALPVDIIKIDGSFARDLSRNRQNQVFIRSLLDLAGAFGVKTVVEWVENEETAALLTSWGVDYLQGHQFGHASTASPFVLADPVQRLVANG